MLDDAVAAQALDAVADDTFRGSVAEAAGDLCTGDATVLVEQLHDAQVSAIELSFHLTSPEADGRGHIPPLFPNSVNGAVRLSEAANAWSVPVRKGPWNRIPVERGPKSGEKYLLTTDSDSEGAVRSYHGRSLGGPGRPLSRVPGGSNVFRFRSGFVTSRRATMRVRAGDRAAPAGLDWALTRAVAASSCRGRPRRTKKAPRGTGPSSRALARPLWGRLASTLQQRGHVKYRQTVLRNY